MSASPAQSQGSLRGSGTGSTILSSAHTPVRSNTFNWIDGGVLPIRAWRSVGHVHRVCNEKTYIGGSSSARSSIANDSKSSSNLKDVTNVSETLSKSLSKNNSSSGFSKPGQSKGSESLISYFDNTIETTNQFHQWYQKIEDEMLHEEDEQYKIHLESLLFLKDWCSVQLIRIDSIVESLDELEKEHSHVQERTRVLNDACERLLNEKRVANDVVIELAERLAFFDVLEPSMALFSMPGEAICLDPQFIPAIKNLEKSIDFVKSHNDYNGAELYLMRFNQCLTRGLTLISMYVSNVFSASISQIHEEIELKLNGDSSKQSTNVDKKQQYLTPNQQMTFFYVKFGAYNSKLRPLIEELEVRCENRVEYQSLYNDCVNSYFNTRRYLLKDYIAKYIIGICEENDLLLTCRSGLTYVMRLCADEVALFRQFFKLFSSSLVDYIGYISSFLYSALRPMVLREQSVEKLSELCHTLRIYLETNENSVARIASGESTTVTGMPVDVIQRTKDQQQLFIIVKRILEDTQQRLSFRAQGYISNEIQGLKLKEVEITVLLETYKRNRDLYLKSSSNENNEVDNSEIYGGGSYYPTVSKTVFTLERLKGCIPDTVFKDLYKIAIQHCKSSLDYATQLIENSSGIEDGKLFRECNESYLRGKISQLGLEFEN